MRDEPPRATAMKLVAAGMVTMTEAAMLAGVSIQAVRKWCVVAGIDARARRVAYVGRLWRMRSGGAARPEDSADMMIRPPLNARKWPALNALRAGKVNVEGAAKLAGVPVSGIVGWCKLHKIDLPSDYVPEQRRNRSRNVADCNNS